MSTPTDAAEVAMQTRSQVETARIQHAMKEKHNVGMVIVLVFLNVFVLALCIAAWVAGSMLINMGTADPQNATQTSTGIALVVLATFTMVMTIVLDVLLGRELVAKSERIRMEKGEPLMVKKTTQTAVAMTG